MTAVYLFRRGKVLLLYKEGGRVVNHVWTGSAGGHFEKAELNDAKACVLREMEEELGLTGADIEGLTLRYVALRNTKGEIRQNYYFFADLKPHVEENLTSTEGTCRWFSLEDIGELPMPLSAKYVMDHFRRVGRLTTELYAAVVGPDRAEIFPLPES